MTVLSERELVVLTAIAEGETFMRLSRRLHISDSAVAMVAWRLRARVGALTNAHLVAIALRTGLLPLPCGPVRREDEPYDPPAHPGDPARFPLGAGLPRKAYPYRTASKEQS